MRLLFRKKTGAVFVHPLMSAPRTMILAPGFRNTRAVRVFTGGWCDEAARFGPSSVAAPFEELQRLAQQGVKLRHAVVVFTYGEQPHLSDQDRDFLWEAFGVPIFEQCLGPNNELLAAECEAHDGLHVLGAAERMAVEKGVCACGSAVPRLMPQRQRTRAVSLVA